MGGRGGRRTASTVACLLSAVLLCACSGASGSAGTGADAGAGAGAASSADVVTTADCQAPQVLAALGLATGSATPPGRVTHPDVPAAGAVPPGFAAESVLVCSRGGDLRDAQGAWSSVTATQREGDLSELLAALAGWSPEGTVAAGIAADCVPGPRAVQLWLVDVLGRAIRVATPDRACGVPVPTVTAALDALRVTDASSFPVGLVAATPGG